MKVNPNRPVSAATLTSPSTKRATVASTAPETDFQASAKLALKLAATPETRADQVARAKALVADPNYPNTATINKVAQRLAGQIESAAAKE